MLKQLINDLEIKKAYKHARKCRELHMSSPTICTWNYEVVKEKDNKVVEKGRQLTHSYTRNFHNWLTLNTMFFPHNTSLIGSTYGEGSLAIKETNNTIHPTQILYTLCVTSAINSSGSGIVSAGNGGIWAGTNSTFGIVFGTSNTAESLNDFEIGELIAHSAGVREYLTMVRGDLSYDSTSKTWSIDWTRSFRNISGSDITIREVGVIAALSANFATRFALIIRDVLTTPIVVANNERINFTYRFSYVI